MNLIKSTKLIGLAAILCGGLLLSMRNLSDPQPTEAMPQQSQMTPAKVVIMILNGDTISSDTKFDPEKVTYMRTERARDTVWVHINTK